MITSGGYLDVGAFMRITGVRMVGPVPITAAPLPVYTTIGGEYSLSRLHNQTPAQGALSPVHYSRYDEEDGYGTSSLSSRVYAHIIDEDLILVSDQGSYKMLDLERVNADNCEVVFTGIKSDQGGLIQGEVGISDEDSGHADWIAGSLPTNTVIPLRSVNSSQFIGVEVSTNADNFTSSWRSIDMQVGIAVRAIGSAEEIVHSTSSAYLNVHSGS